MPDEVRQRLAVALDVDDLVAALRIARQVRPWFGVAKVGLELYFAEGPGTVEALLDLGFDVLLDLKLHDIPNTVLRASRVVGALGVQYLTVHTAGGMAMLQAAVEGATAGADAVDVSPPKVLGVTVLTSERDVVPDVLRDRMTLAERAGCAGIVCASPDLGVAGEVVPDLLKVTPGIRPPGAPPGDQARIATPGEAFAAGASVIVVGRPVSQADDPAAAASAIVDDILGGV
ncbi:MAG: orotidine-5'-phosphate decarboxylase [Actinobacteria bacterium]|nr:orotidine-5'-phosphate decarboxylase [Actinomycetota bacterium]